jgi:AcrR family transcriptional regulator
MLRMSTPGRPKIHEDLSREKIAQVAVDLIDREGADALSLRRIAAELDVGAATLYQYITGRPMIVQDVVALLLDEVDTTERRDERWDDSIRRVARSLREMALRHPRAFVLVAMVPVDEPALRDYTSRLMRLHAHQSIPSETFARMWSVVDAFLTGFLFLQSSAMTQRHPQDASPLEPPAVSVERVLSTEAFEHDLEIVIEGIRALEKPPRG